MRASPFSAAGIFAAAAAAQFPHPEDENVEPSAQFSDDAYDRCFRG